MAAKNAEPALESDQQQRELTRRIALAEDDAAQESDRRNRQRYIEGCRNMGTGSLLTSA